MKLGLFGFSLLACLIALYAFSITLITLFATSCDNKYVPDLNTIAVSCGVGTVVRSREAGSIAAKWCALDSLSNGTPNGEIIIVGPTAEAEIKGQYNAGAKVGTWRYRDEVATRYFEFRGGHVVKKEARRNGTNALARRGEVRCQPSTEGLKCECVLTIYDNNGKEHDERKSGDNCDHELPRHINFAEGN